VDLEEDQKVEAPLLGAQQPWKMSRQKRSQMTIYVTNFLLYFNPSDNIYLVRVNVSSNILKHPFKLRNLMA
jgi:hypothetical protein